MLTADEARARVAKGAAYLDRAYPGWASRMDIGTLDVSSGTDCIACQISNAFNGEPMYRSELGVDISIHGWVEHGTMLSAVGVFGEPFTVGYRALQDAWIEAIADRVVRDAPLPAPEQPETADAVARTAGSTTGSPCAQKSL